MRNTLLYFFILILGFATASQAQTTALTDGASIQIQPALSPPASPSAEPELINQILSLFGEAVITRLDARVSLESFEVEEGRVRLTGVLLKNLNVGLRLNAKGTQRLAQTLQQRYAQKPATSQLGQLLEIIKLGIFNQLEINVHLDELRVRRLAIDAEDLELQGLLLQVGATPPDPVTGKPRSDTLQTLLDILRRTSLNQIKAEAGIEKLRASRAHLELWAISYRVCS